MSRQTKLLHRRRAPLAMRPALYMLGLKSFRDFLRLSRIGVAERVANLGIGMESLHSNLEFVHENSEKSPCLFCDRSKKEKGYFFDEVIVGSGPGGAIAAHHSVMKGNKTLLIEKGRRVSGSPHQSPSQLILDFDFGAQQFGFLDKQVFQFSQGSCWGGGSEVNSGLYHSLPAPLARDWGIKTGISPAELKGADSRVRAALSVSKQSLSAMGIYGVSRIVELANTMAYSAKVVERWRSYSSPKDFQHHGMGTTYLRKFEAGGGHSLLGARVVRIKASKDKVLPVRVLVRCNRGKTHWVSSLRRVVLAAGVLETPKILVKSRLAKTSEFRFGTHVMGRMFIRYNEEVNDGSDIDPHQAFDPLGPGKIGMSVVNEHILASILSAEGFDNINPRHVVPLYYSLPFEGQSKIRYVPGVGMTPFLLSKESFKTDLESLRNRVIAAISETKGELLLSGPSFSSVHIFGSMAIGSSALVDEKGYLRGFGDKIAIRDASILPTAPGVNPQGPLMTLVEALEAA